MGSAPVLEIPHFACRIRPVQSPTARTPRKGSSELREVFPFWKCNTLHVESAPCNRPPRLPLGRAHASCGKCSRSGNTTLCMSNPLRAITHRAPPRERSSELREVIPFCTLHVESAPCNHPPRLPPREGTSELRELLPFWKYHTLHVESAPCNHPPRLPLRRAQSSCGKCSRSALCMSNPPSAITNRASP